MARDNGSPNSSNENPDLLVEGIHGVVHKLVVESIEEADTHTREGEERIAVNEEVVPVREGVLPAGLRPVQAGTRTIAELTTRGAAIATSRIVEGGQYSVAAAGRLRRLATGGLKFVTDPQQIRDLLDEAEDEGRWLMDGLTALLGFGQFNR